MNDDFLFLEETLDFEAELASALAELSEEEKESLLDSCDLPECLIEALQTKQENEYGLKRIA